MRPKTMLLQQKYATVRNGFSSQSDSISMHTIFYPAQSRGYAKHGWLESHHSFSFASYYDPSRMGFGALRVINDDVIAPGQGFGRHPHNDMEIITVPLSGALSHRDSMGNIETIHTGEVQVMSAGTGVEHAEFNASETEEVRLLQIWILTRMFGITPRYAQKSFEKNLFTNTLYPIVGPEKSEKNGSLAICQDAFLSLGKYDMDADIEYVIQKKGNGVYFFLIEGEMMIENTVLKTRDALGIWEAEKIHLQVQKGAFMLSIEVPMEAL